MKTGSEAIRALAMQIPAFRQKLSDGWYQVRIAGRDAGETELSARLNEPLENGAVIHIVPRPAGAKSGGIFQAVLRLVHMDTPSPLTLLVTRKTPSKTSHLTIL